MSGSDLLGEFEQLVLLAILQQRGDGYALPVREAIEDATERPVSRGALYRTLDRLGAKGLVASALEPASVGQLRLRGSLGSLKQAIEKNWSARETPEVFCFGMLESFDILQLAAMSAPRRVRFESADERVREELSGLGAWYRTWGVTFDPLANE